MSWLTRLTSDTYNIIETVEYNPRRVVKVKKMIWSDEAQEFKTHYFLRVMCDDRACRDATVEWLEQQFGAARYQGSWWQDPQNGLMLWMADSLATFWQLKYGDRG